MKNEKTYKIEKIVTEILKTFDVTKSLWEEIVEEINSEYEDESNKVTLPKKKDQKFNISSKIFPF